MYIYIYIGFAVKRASIWDGSRLFTTGEQEEKRGWLSRGLFFCRGLQSFVIDFLSAPELLLRPCDYFRRTFLRVRVSFRSQKHWSSLLLASFPNARFNVQFSRSELLIWISISFPSFRCLWYIYIYIYIYYFAVHYSLYILNQIIISLQIYTMYLINVFQAYRHWRWSIPRFEYNNYQISVQNGYLFQTSSQWKRHYNLFLKL